MKVFAVLLFVALAAYTQAQTAIKYDNVDLDAILKSDQQLQTYINCFLDKGTCSTDGTDLKKNLADALKTDCAKCSPKNKEGLKKILAHLIKNKQGWFNALEAKYDSTGLYRKKHASELKKL